jgi:tetratricopeptide (TPR) repeat protein
MLAVCRWYARTQFQGQKYKLTIYVNDLLAEELTVDGASRTQIVDIPKELLDPNKRKQRVRFELEGRGRYTYQCVLGGFVPAAQITSTTGQWQVTRICEPAPLELDGWTVPRGFNVLTGSYRAFRNSLGQLPVGCRAHVELQIQRTNVPSNTPEEHLPYLVVSEPLPAGLAVIESSVRGGFERFQLSPGFVTFYLNPQRQLEPIHYDVHGYLAGTYRAGPTIVRDAYRPDQFAAARSKELDVLPQGEPSGDAYRFSPRELYELGRRHYGKGRFAQAGPLLNELFRDWNLADRYYRETVRMLLDIHLQEGPASQVVRYFEIIIEKFPDLEIPFAKLLQVGDAYHKIGEYERSYLVFRAAVEANFLRESRVAGFLESQDEFLRSVDVMTDLLGEYPPEPYLATAAYALAQRVYAKAPKAASDRKLRERAVTRVDLIRQAGDRLDAFLTAFPDDPAADEAAFSLANALLDLKLYGRAIADCQRFVVRYPDSKFLDSYWYIVGYSHFAMQQHQQALAMCSKVAQAKRKDPASGRLVESPNKWQAVYILGQIHHSLGEAAAAIREYERVADRFVDARQAIDYFARKDITLPEVTSFQPDEAIRVDLEFRNVASCDVTVYRIDLMKFSLLRRDLSDITNINLAGIRPYHQATLPLGDGKDYRDREMVLPLPLKQEGAYLVVCRAGNLYTSGMVLVSPLTLDIQEQSDSGRVRTTVRDAVSGKYASGVHVKVIGTRNEDFISGETDLRGIFVADGIRGRSMVIAQADGGRYAFSRGQTELGPASKEGIPSAPEPMSDADPYAAEQPDAGELLQGLKDANMSIQDEQQEQLQDVYDNSVEEGIGGGFGGGIF